MIDEIVGLGLICFSEGRVAFFFLNEDFFPDLLNLMLLDVVKLKAFDLHGFKSFLSHG